MFQRLILIAMVSIFVLAPAPLKAGAESSYYYYYFKEKQALGVDTSRIAVLERSKVRAANRFEAFGIADGGVEAHAMPGWSLTKVPAGVRSVGEVAQLVGQMSAAEAADFISPVFTGAKGKPVIVSPDILMRFNEGVGCEEAEAILAKADVGTIAETDWAGMSNAYRIRATSRDGLKVLAAANRLAEREEVEFAAPDMILTGKAGYIPDDTMFSKCWGIHNTGQEGGTEDMDMDGPEAWDVTTGDPCVIVVILDCGVADHYDINQRQGIDFTVEPPLDNGWPKETYDNHGTAVAGCVSAKIDGQGVVGIAPDCKIASARVHVTTSPSGDFSFYASDVVEGIQWAETIGAQITNNSNSYSQLYSGITSKYQDTYDKGIIHFASAGNNGEVNDINYPASLSMVNAVGAINRNGNRAGFSNYGNGLAFVAPGVEISTTDRYSVNGYAPGPYCEVDGTSFASPYAAGVAALMLSNDANLTGPQVERRMREGCMDLGDEGWDPEFGWGLVNAYESLFGTYYVDDDAPDDPGPGSPAVSDPCEDGSVDHPFDAIQEAIDVICGPGVVVVRDGTYTGTGNKNIDFDGKAITLRSENGADVTIIDCENSMRGFYFHNGEGADSVVDGFKIINGFGAPGLGYGGGIWCAYSSPTIINCTISNCSAAISTSEGGGMSNFYCSPTVTDCAFNDNSSAWGGGMYNYESNPTVTNCTFKNNLAICEGGGMYNDDSDGVKLVNCTFNGNRANDLGGGMENIQWSEPALINCTFSGNSASWGGGIFNAYSEPTLVNCTFSGNLADDHGGGIYNYSNSSQTLNNCILWGNSAPIGAEIYDDATSSSTVSYSDIQGGYAGTGNKDTDPCFLRVPNDGGDGWGDDPSTSGVDEGANDDYGDLRLTAASKCIDEGDNNALPADVTDMDNDGNTTEPIPYDLDGRERITDGDCNDTNIVDMGAYEFTHAYIGDFDSQCDVDFVDYAILANYWLTDELLVDIAPTPAGDSIVDEKDLAILCDNWLADAEP